MQPAPKSQAISLEGCVNARRRDAGVLCLFKGHVPHARQVVVDNVTDALLADKGSSLTVKNFTGDPNRRAGGKEGKEGRKGGRGIVCACCTGNAPPTCCLFFGRAPALAWVMPVFVLVPLWGGGRAAPKSLFLQAKKGTYSASKINCARFRE